MGCEPGSFFGAGTHFHNNSEWDYSWPDLQRPIGAPLGDARQDGLNFAREFEHVTAEIDCSGSHTTGKITWKD